MLERRRAHLLHETFFVAAHLRRTGELTRSTALLEQVTALLG